MGSIAHEALVLTGDASFCLSCAAARLDVAADMASAADAEVDDDADDAVDDTTAADETKAITESSLVVIWCTFLIVSIQFPITDSIHGNRPKQSCWIDGAK